MRNLLLSITIFCLVSLQAAPLRVGMLFPDFTAISLEGKPIDREKLVGKITVINFWYQSCAPCIAEFDALNEFYGKFKDNSAFQFVSFTFDSEEDAKKTVQKFNIPYDVFSLKKEECIRLKGNNKFPTTVIVDQTGRIAFIKEGGAIVKNLSAIEVQKVELFTAYLLTQNNPTSSKYTYSVSVLPQQETDMMDFDKDDILRKYLTEHWNEIQAKVGTLFPAFTATSLTGQPISDKQLMDKVTIINFWFAGCSPCIAEFDALNTLFYKFKENSSFQFLSFTSDPEESARETILKYNIPYEVFSINRDECSRLNCNNGFPTTIIVNPSGKMVVIKSGGNSDPIKAVKEVAEFDQVIQTLLEKTQ